MNKPPKPDRCSRSFNMKHMCKESRNVRIVCMYAKHRELIHDLLKSVGGSETSDICDEHFEWAMWHANQPESEEERLKRERFEKMKEEVRERIERTA